jgi:HEAT repeat protein
VSKINFLGMFLIRSQIFMRTYFLGKAQAGWILGASLLVGILTIQAAGAEEGKTASADIPTLLHRLQTGDGEAKIHALLRLEEKKSLGDEPTQTLAIIEEQLHDVSPKVRSQAVYALGVFGEQSRPVVKSVYSLLEDKEPVVRRAALRALQAINPPPEEEMPYVIKLLSENDPQLRVEALRVIADDGKAAVAPLQKALENEGEVYWACIGLSEIGPEAAAAVPDLLKVLSEDKRLDVRMQAVMALGGIGAASAPAVPKLKAILEQGDRTLLPATLYALGKIGPAASPAEALLRKEMASTKPFEKVVSAWAVAKLDPQDHTRVQAAVPILVEGLTSKDVRVRSAAARSLFDLHPGPAVVQPLLKKAMENADRETVGNVIDAVAGLGKPVVPMLIKALKDNPESRPRVAAVLAQIGLDAKEAAPALAEVVADDKNPEVRREALFALAAIGPGAADQASAVAAVLKEDDERLRALAAYALGKMGPGAISAKAALQKQLEGEEFSALAAAWALAHIDPQCPETPKKSVPCLIKGLHNPVEKIRLEAADSLKRLGPRATEAVAELKLAAEKDTESSVRQAAIDALEAIEK